VSELLRDRFGYDISEVAIRQGLNIVKWPGRLELMSENPKILLDGAHNVDGMNSLVNALKYYQQGLYKHQRLVLCLGMLGDKEIEKAVGLIGPLADVIMVTKPDSSRAGDWKYPALIAEQYVSKDNLYVIEDPVLAVSKCLEMLNPEDMLCITGSLYMLGPVRQYLLKKIKH